MAKVFESVRAGQVFGRLTATSDAYTKGKYKYVSVECSCGVRKEVAQASLLKGASKSCGCLSAELTSARSTTHGMRSSPVYAVWNSMVQRCCNAENVQYPDYGGRGITVQDAWRTFEGFYADMGDPPFKGAMLERIDNDKGYYKDNCTWATRTEQNRNQRKNKLYTFNGETQGLWVWAERLNIPYKILHQRINTYSMTVEEAFTKPYQKR